MEKEKLFIEIFDELSQLSALFEATARTAFHNPDREGEAPDLEQLSKIGHLNELKNKLVQNIENQLVELKSELK